MRRAIYMLHTAFWGTLFLIGMCALLIVSLVVRVVGR